MKISKMVKKLNALFDNHQRERQRQRKELKAALRKLRHKQHELDDALAACHEPTARQELEEKISILAAQRRKGLELLRELNDSPAPEDKPATDV
ncbi:hypothetical protein GJQ54_01005 [Oceanospirillaceae bacterium ASx5O]|nr:hypothetical protein GJQ54_01005 [Oceanospirillaceae bacterium ASx5O]